MTLQELIAQGCPEPIVRPVNERGVSALAGRIEELAARRDFAGISRLGSEYPVSAPMLDYLKEAVGLGFLLQKQLNLADAVGKYGESWLQSDEHSRAGQWADIPDAVGASIVAGDLLLENPRNNAVLKALTAALTTVMNKKDFRSVCLLELIAIERDAACFGSIPSQHEESRAALASLLHSLEQRG